MKQLFTILPLTLPLQAATTLTEISSGDFSDDFSNPTEMMLMPGVNILSFTIGTMPDNGGGTGATNGSDADYILFRVPAGTSVTEIRVSNSEGGRHFFGAKLGTSFLVTPANSSAFANSLDANFTFSQGSDLAQQFREDPNQDFIALFQETTDVSSSVTINITVVPEPSSAMLLLLGALPLLRRQR